MPSEMTGTVKDFARMDLPCPKCGQTNKELITELETTDTVACKYCGGTIDLSSKDIRARITTFAKDAQEVYKMDFNRPL